MPHPRSQRVAFIFSSKSFMVFVSTFRSMVHFEIVVVYGCEVGVQPQFYNVEMQIVHHGGHGWDLKGHLELVNFLNIPPEEKEAWEVPSLGLTQG